MRGRLGRRGGCRASQVGAARRRTVRIVLETSSCASCSHAGVRPMLSAVPGRALARCRLSMATRSCVSSSTTGDGGSGGRGAASGCEPSAGRKTERRTSAASLRCRSANSLFKGSRMSGVMSRLNGPGAARPASRHTSELAPSSHASASASASASTCSGPSVSSTTPGPASFGSARRSGTEPSADAWAQSCRPSEPAESSCVRTCGGSSDITRSCLADSAASSACARSATSGTTYLRRSVGQLPSWLIASRSDARSSSCRHSIGSFSSTEGPASASRTAAGAGDEAEVLRGRARGRRRSERRILIMGPRGLPDGRSK